MPGFPEPPRYRADVRRQPEEIVVVVSGELDIASASDFEAVLREELARGPVLLDLAELSFMDSTGVHALDAILRDAAAQRWVLRVRPDLHDNVRHVLQITALYDALPFGDDGARA